MTENLLQEIEKYKEIRNMNMLLESRWLSMFLDLLDFKEKYGHIDVPAKFKEYRTLGYWVRRQRLVFAESKMDPFRERLLKLAGFNFRLMDFHDWGKMHQKLEEFKNEFGHVHIKENYKDSQLHNWLVYQRKLYWRNKLPKQKLDKLKKLGVNMQNKTLNRWENKFNRLLKFKKRNRHMHVSASYTRDVELISFVKVLRRNKNKITAERRKLLDDIGFIWEPGKELSVILNRQRADKAWLIRFDELKSYKEQFGTTHILTTSKTHHSLADWVSKQRCNIEILTPDKLDKLKEIDFFKDNQPRKIKK